MGTRSRILQHPLATAQRRPSHAPGLTGHTEERLVGAFFNELRFKEERTKLRPEMRI